MPDWTLARDAFGRLCILKAGGEPVVVTAVRAYPLSAPGESIALVDEHGHEQAWIARLDELEADVRTLVAEALREREFMPTIERLVSVSTFATPSTWTVATDRGQARFVLRGEEDIRRLPAGALLVADHHGVQYLIRDLAALDRHSRRLLDRFL